MLKNSKWRSRVIIHARARVKMMNIQILQKQRQHQRKQWKHRSCYVTMTISAHEILNYMSVEDQLVMQNIDQQGQFYVLHPQRCKYLKTMVLYHIHSCMSEKLYIFNKHISKVCFVRIQSRQGRNKVYFIPPDPPFRP